MCFGARAGWQCIGHVGSGRLSFQVQCYFTSTEAVLTIRDGEPGTSTSTFTQLLVFFGGYHPEFEGEKKEEKKSSRVICSVLLLLR